MLPYRCTSRFLSPFVLCIPAALFVALMPRPAGAQLAPTGDHYAGRPSDSGFVPGELTSSGGYATSVPLDLPAARGDVPLPLQIVYGARGVGAAGLGWDVPLSYIRSDAGFAHRRPTNIDASSAPTASARVTMSLLGQQIDLVPSGGALVARNGTLALRVVARSDGALIAYDGKGFTYTFTQAEPDLYSLGIWLLRTISNATGNTVTLQYLVSTQPAGPGNGNAVQIDLQHIRYNTHPSTTCAKHDIVLSYGPPSTSALSLKVVGSGVLARMDTLTDIFVQVYPSCSASTPTTLRQYHLAYSPDADLGQPRLTAVTVNGRSDSTEKSTWLPVASYQYGSASHGGSVVYEKAPQSIALPISTPAIAATGGVTSLNGPHATGYGYGMLQDFTDFNGDGRPDLIFTSGGQLVIAPAQTTGSGTTLGTPTPFLGAAIGDRLETRWQSAARFTPTVTDEVWRKAIDVNGDGRIDIVDAACKRADGSSSSTRPRPTARPDITWLRRSFVINDLYNAMKARNLPVYPDYIPLSSRTTSRDTKWNACDKWNGSSFADDPAGFGAERLHGPARPDRQSVSAHLREIDHGVGRARHQRRRLPRRRVRLVAARGYARRRHRHCDDSPGRATSSAPCGSVRPRAPRSTPCSTSPACSWTIRRRGPSPRRSRYDDRLRRQSWDQHRPMLQDHTGTHPSGNYQRQAVRPRRRQRRCAARPSGRRRSSISALAAASPTSPSPPPVAIAQQSYHSWRAGEIRRRTARATPTSSAACATSTATASPTPSQRQRQHLDGLVRHRRRLQTGDPHRQRRSPSASRRRSRPATARLADAGGLFDIDGDGKPEMVQLKRRQPRRLSARRQQLAARPRGRPSHAVDNGYGAITSITYRSAKEDPHTSHQVPFPEIVVSQIETKGHARARRHAGDDALRLRRRADVLRPEARALELPRTTGAWSSCAPRDLGQIVRRRDHHRSLRRCPPSPAVDDAGQRFGRYQRAGRVSDVTVLAGSIGTDAWSLLNVNIGSDARRVGSTHLHVRHDVLPRELRRAGLGDVRPHVSVRLGDVVRRGNNASFDATRAHGFIFRTDARQLARQRRSAVGEQRRASATPSAASTRSAMRSASTTRATSIAATTTSASTRPSPRVRPRRAPASKAATRAVSGCNPLGAAPYVFASERFEYDQLAVGTVAAGLTDRAHRRSPRRRQRRAPRHRSRVRRGLRRGRQPQAITRTREDGAQQVTTMTYDAFGLAPTRVAVSGTGVPRSPPPTPSTP